MVGPHDRPVPAHAGQVRELKDFQDCPAVIYDARLKPTMSEPSSVLAREGGQLSPVCPFRALARGKLSEGAKPDILSTEYYPARSLDGC